MIKVHHIFKYIIYIYFTNYYYLLIYIIFLIIIKYFDFMAKYHHKSNHIININMNEIVINTLNMYYDNKIDRFSFKNYKILNHKYLI